MAEKPVGLGTKLAFLALGLVTAGVAGPGGLGPWEGNGKMLVAKTLTPGAVSLPPLDVQPPGRVETFTFGLG